jgi:Flp pilus assembly protein TadD
VAIAAALIVAVIAAWAEWQPLRSQHAANQALASLGHSQPRALALAQTAVDRDPLSVYPLFDLSAIQSNAGQLAAARQTLVRAVRLQPANPQTWLALASFDVGQHPRTALADLRPALFLDPEGPRTQAQYLAALRASRPGARIAGALPVRPVNNPGAVGPSG